MINFFLAGDVWFENLMLALRTPALLQAFSAITFFGNTTTVAAIAGIIGAYVLFCKRDRLSYLAGLAITLGGATASGYILKALVERMRPGGLIPAVVETSFSFPSGHATAAMALYGFIAFFLCRQYPEHKRVVIVVSTLIILAIGFSRLYLGVHFPSDVIAGYVVGGAWLLIGIKITDRLSVR